MARRILIVAAVVAYLVGVVYIGLEKAREATARAERVAELVAPSATPVATPAPAPTPAPTPTETEDATAAATEDATPIETETAAEPTTLAEAPPAPARRSAPDPAAPSGLEVKAVSPSSIALEWSAGAGAGVAGYQIVRDGKPLAELVPGTAFSDEGLGPRTKHCYAVAAVDQAGHRSARSRQACAQTPDWVPPTVPSQLEARALAERQVAIAWSASTDDVGVAAYEVLRGETVVARLAGTGITESGLAPAQTYCYAVRALDAAGNASEPAGPACATTPDLTPPSAPDAFVAEAAGEHAVKVRWNPAADDVGVAGYELLRAGEVIASTAELVATVRGQRPLQEVCLAARAFDAAGNRSAASAPACATPPDLTAPTVPRAPTLTATTEQRILIRWGASQDEVAVASYDVEREGKVVATTDATQASEEGLRPGQEVCYTVRASDTVGNVSAPSKRACAVMPDLTPPTAPPRFAAAPSSPSNVAFAWGAASDNVGVAAYELRREGQVVARVDAAAARATDAGLAPATRHCFELVAVDRAGNRSPPAEACATTPEPGVPSGPTALRAEPKAPTMVVLRWDSSPDPDVVYTVYWDGGKKIGATASTQYTVAGLRTGERRCYRVAAMDPSGKESPRTMEACTAAVAPKP